jgi:hypothetical protein
MRETEQIKKEKDKNRYLNDLTDSVRSTIKSYFLGLFREI